MNIISKFLRGKQSKRGASLPMVVAIGSALVIWVMALMPLVVTHGTTAIKLTSDENKYLSSRSAIEFAKSELYDMVREYVPYTFAIIGDGTNSKYSSVIKAKSSDYLTYVNSNADDMKDVPKNNEHGKKVSAICAVIPPVGSNRAYNIKITTYDNGKAGMTYSTTYTVPVGTLVIHPESYKKTQALPLSDYILIDGKVGSNILWNSSITTDSSGLAYNNYFNKNSQDRFLSFKEDYKETLLALDDKGQIKADAGNYITVFKTTATASPEALIPPKPQNPATSSSKLNFVTEPAAPDCKIEKTEKSNGSVTVTLTNCGANALYCYSKTPNATGVEWQTSNTFTFSEGGSYYFFCYIAGHANGNTLYYDSAVKYAGYTYLYSFNHNNRVTTLESGKQYIMYTYSEDSRGNRTYTALNGAGGQLGKETIAAGLNEFTDSDTKLWTVTSQKVSGSWGSSSYYNYQFENGGKWLEYYETSRYYQTTRSFRLGSKANLRYSSDTNSVYSVQSSKNYYLSLTESTFCSTSYTSQGSKIYFFPVTPPSFAGEVTLPQRLSNGVNIERNFEKDEGITQSEIRELYTVSGATNVNYYIDPAPTPAGCDPLPGDYDIYATFNISGKPAFAKLGTLKVVDVVEQNIPRGSGIAASSLYFMGSSAAFSTQNTTIYLDADLLVIRSSVLSSTPGSVIVNPYTDGKDKTLVFFVGGVKINNQQIFKPYCFYEVPAGTDILAMNDPVLADSWLCRDTAGDCVNGSYVTYKSNGTIESVIFPKALLYLESFGIYPTINLDIAYATDEQLAHLVSGEAIRWTRDGVLIGQNSTDNGMFVVCPYITSVSGTVNYSANRILLTTPPEGLNVSQSLTFYCRYLSFSTQSIRQTAASASFNVHSVTTNTSFLDWINKLLGDIDYNSNTLQVDYENPTVISMYSGNEVNMAAQICRYKSGTNLFEAPEGSKQELQVSYTTDNINNTFSGGTSNITVVERYMNIIMGANDSGLDFVTVSLFGLNPHELKLYTNYLSFGKGVDKLTLYKSGWLILSGTADIIINSQETGYTENEYLFFFRTTSADSYTGTMVFVEEDISVVMKNSTKTLAKGFYFVAATDGGTSITDLVNNPAKYKVETEDLNKYSNYIKSDGSISDSYVDTGLENSDAILGGFGGGSIN